MNIPMADVTSLQEAVIDDRQVPQLSDDPYLDILQNIFHHQNFRGIQRDAIECIALDKDALVVIPTGGGKSSCYWIPGMAMSGVTVVITPLMALQSDQVNKLRNYGIKVCSVNSSMPEEEREIVFHSLSQPETAFKFFYLTPEFALSPPAMACFKSMVENKSLLRFIVDEAHCVDMWGQNFRPSYGKLGNLKQFGRPIAAFTGTATNITKERIVKNLGLHEAVVLQSTCNRSNLIFNVVSKSGPHAKEDVVKYVQDNYRDSCGIVYCSTTKDTVELAYIFKSKGLSAVYYHGKLDFFEKNDNAKDWLSGKASVMCATSAFGMGIDKPNVRFVVHLSLPKSLEEYYQEAGRAGRDGTKSHCTLMYRFEDRNKLIQLISKSSSEEHLEFQMTSLNKVVSYCMSHVCRRKQLMEYFDDETEANCNGTCDNCSKTPPAIKDYTNESINVCHCVEEMLAVNAKINVKQVALAFKGSKSKRDIESKGFHVISHYGSGRNVFNNDADAIKFVQHLIVHEVLLENIRAVDDRFTTPYITLGKKAQSLINREICVFLMI